MTNHVTFSEFMYSNNLPPGSNRQPRDAKCTTTKRRALVWFEGLPINQLSLDGYVNNVDLTHDGTEPTGGNRFSHPLQQAPGETSHDGLLLELIDLYRPKNRPFLNTFQNSSAEKGPKRTHLSEAEDSGIIYFPEACWKPL